MFSNLSQPSGRYIMMSHHCECLWHFCVNSAHFICQTPPICTSKLSLGLSVLEATFRSLHFPRKIQIIMQDIVAQLQGNECLNPYPSTYCKILKKSCLYLHLGKNVHSWCIYGYAKYRFHSDLQSRQIQSSGKFVMEADPIQLHHKISRINKGVPLWAQTGDCKYNMKQYDINNLNVYTSQRFCSFLKEVCNKIYPKNTFKVYRMCKRTSLKLLAMISVKALP